MSDARDVAGLLDRLDDQVDGRPVGRQRRREPALVAQPGGVALGLQHRLERVVGLRPPAQRLAEGGRADRRDHELLHVHVAVGVRAAVEDVQHRHRQDVRVRSADVAEQVEVGGLRGGLGHRQRHPEDRVRPEPALVRRAVDLDQLGVDHALLGGVVPDQGRADLVQHGLDGVQHALAAVTVRVAVTQFDGFVLAGRRTGRDRRPGQRAVLQRDLDLDGGVAARVEDLPCTDQFNCRHSNSPSSQSGAGGLRSPEPEPRGRTRAEAARPSLSTDSWHTEPDSPGPTSPASSASQPPAGTGGRSQSSLRIRSTTREP